MLQTKPVSESIPGLGMRLSSLMSRLAINIVGLIECWWLNEANAAS